MATPVYSLLLPALGALLLLVGVVLVKLGHWPRRTGAVLHCAACDYILTGAEQRCPECGTAVGESTVVRGRRRRKHGLTAAGVAFALFGGMLVGVFLTSLTGTIDWNRHKPLGWLLRDLDTPAAAGPAWAEIRRRLDAGTVAERDQSAIVDKALQAQASARPSPVLPSLLEFVAVRFLDGKLTNAQADRFFAGALKVDLAARPVVGSQSPLACAVRGNGRGPAGWWLRTRILEAQVDDGPPQKQGGSTAGQFGGWSSGVLLPPVPTPGKHRLRVRLEMAADPSQAKLWIDSAPVARRDSKELSAEFEVIEGQTPVETDTVPDAEALARRLRARLTFNPATRYLDGMIDTDSLPVDTAFDVFARFNDHEYRLGGINFHKNTPSGYSIGKGKFPSDPPAKIDLVLRGSEPVARETVDLKRIWNGEIVLHDVEVTRTGK